MQTRRPRRAALAASLLVPLAAPVLAQTPVRQGASTQMALGACCCDARTPVQSVPGNSNWRHVITEPGSYYLADDVVGAQNFGAIRVDVSGVTIDFNGFALIGTAPGSLSSIASTFDDVTLRGGGRIQGWSAGVFLAGKRCRVEDLTVTGSLTNGLQILGADGAVERCIVADHGWKGIYLGPDADGTTVRDCKVRDNGQHQIHVESDGGAVERCSVAASLVNQPLVAVDGSANRLLGNTVISRAVGEKAVSVAGDANRLVDTTVRLESEAVFGQGISVTGAANEVRGGGVTVEAELATAVRFDQPLSIVAVLIGLLPPASDSTGILANAPGYIEQGNLAVGAPDAVGVDIQGDLANVGTALVKSRIRVTGAGSAAVRSLASASIVQMNGIVLEPSATGAVGVETAGGPGGHHISQNHLLVAGANQSGRVLNGVGDVDERNETLVLGPDSTAIRKLSGTAGMIRDNRIRLADPTATGIFVSEFLGELVSHNVVLGDGNAFDVGEGNVLAQITSNPGFGFVAEDAVNLQIGN